MNRGALHLCVDVEYFHFKTNIAKANQMHPTASFIYLFTILIDYEMPYDIKHFVTYKV